MSELELVGLHEDGERLVLADASGARHTVRIDEALRAAVRRDRPQLEQLRAQAPGTLPVREIQARIRAGLSAEQVAEESGVPVEHVRRYEGPVLAEREHVAGLVRRVALGADGSPTLDDLVADRLAARGVEPSSAVWDSARDAAGTWRASVTFVAGGAQRAATWSYDLGARSVVALDDEARWLSETEIEADPVRRTLTAVHDGLEAVVRPLLAAVDERASWPDAVATDAILDDLERRRGRRTDDGPQEAAAETPDDASAPGAGDDTPEDAREAGDAPDGQSADAAGEEDRPARQRLVAVPATPRTDDDPAADDTDHARPDAAGRPSAARPGHPAGSALHPSRDEHARRTGGRRARTKIPSWDEIMFGSKPEK